MKKSFILPVLALLFAALPAAAPDADRELLRIFHTISSHDILGYAEELSAEKYEGRPAGHPGYDAAAQWVADRLAEWGIRPGGDDGTYFQWFDKPFVEVLSPGALSLHIPGKGGEILTVDYKFPEDYYPGYNSGSGTVSAEVVFAGFGITAPEIGYDDYIGIDVRGKIVLVDTGVPYDGRDPEEITRWEPYSHHTHKLDNAARHGASGLLYIGKAANPNTSYNPGLIYVHVDTPIVDHLFFGTGKSYTAVKERIVKTAEPAPFAIGKKATIDAETVFHPDRKTCNVIGILDGADPVLKDEVVIVGGHLDGIGALAGLFMPGALDNASGCADILGAARALAALPVRPARSIMFLFIGAEETGLQGSMYYTQNPVFPREKTVAYFNLDMVGAGTGLVLGGGRSHPGILQHFETANNRFIHRDMRATEARKPVGRPRSDAVIFIRAGFRTLSIGTMGTDKKIYYHDPRDTTETLTPELMEDVAKWIFLAFAALASDPDLTECSNPAPPGRTQARPTL